jgi:hypothetical protein
VSVSWTDSSIVVSAARRLADRPLPKAPIIWFGLGESGAFGLEITPDCSSALLIVPLCGLGMLLMIPRRLPVSRVAAALAAAADLPVPRLAADAGQGLRGGQARGGEEDAGQFLVGVLTCVHEPRPRPQYARNMRELYYFRAGANHDGYITRRSAAHSLRLFP